MRTFLVHTTEGSKNLVAPNFRLCSSFDWNLTTSCSYLELPPVSVATLISFCSTNYTVTDYFSSSVHRVATQPFLSQSLASFRTHTHTSLHTWAHSLTSQLVRITRSFYHASELLHCSQQFYRLLWNNIYWSDSQSPTYNCRVLHMRWWITGISL